MEISNVQKKFLFDALEYKPHDGQVKVHNLIDHYPVVSAVAGRRFGKSYMATYEAIYQAIQEGDGAGPPVVYIVSDTYDHAGKIFFPILHLFENHPILKKYLVRAYRKNMQIELKTGAKLYAKSADTPQSLAGDSVSFAIIDEAGYVSDEALDVLRPAFAARENPRRLNVGTPDRNDTFFKREFDIGLSEEPGYASLVLPSHVNPLVSEAYLENERKMHSDNNYERMYLAEFSEVDGAPFSKMLDDVELVKPQEPRGARTYVAGVDLAQLQDYTVVVVVDVTEEPFEVVHLSRWNGLTYEVSGKKIADILRRYNYALGYVDSTGVGIAAIDNITRHYGNVEPVSMQLHMQMNAFDQLNAALRDRRLKLLDDRNLLSEFRNLRAITNKRGISYQAPKGLHDDIVKAMFLATRGFSTNAFIPEDAFPMFGIGI